MGPQHAVRRPSYGATSPVIGERGTRTRSLIIEVTLEIIATRGAHLTTVDDIARAAGISRATLYQYFASKAEILVELVEASGTALLKVLKRLGPLGPTAEGLESLRVLFDEWEDVYRLYATIFLQWAALDSPEAPMRPLLASWMNNYTSRLRRQLEAGGVVGVDTADVAIALWAIFERHSFYLRRALDAGGNDANLDLANIAQLILFPHTPSSVLVDAAPERPRLGIPVGRLLEGGPAPGPTDRFHHLGPAARRTVGELLSAGRQVFASVGFHDASVEQVITIAGVARGTFYKYFEGKQDLLTFLSGECVREVEELAVGLGEADSPDSLRLWMDDYVRLYLRQAGVFRVWTEGAVTDQVIEANARRVLTSILSSAEGLLRRTERSYPFDPAAASLMLMGLLERYPGSAKGTRFEREPHQIGSSMTAVVQRGFLNPGSGPTSL